MCALRMLVVRGTPIGESDKPFTFICYTALAAKLNKLPPLVIGCDVAPAFVLPDGDVSGYHSPTIQEPSSSFNIECAPLWDCAQEKEKSWVNVCLTFPLRESLLDLQRKAKHRCSKWPHAMTGLEQCQCPKC